MGEQKKGTVLDCWRFEYEEYRQPKRKTTINDLPTGNRALNFIRAVHSVREVGRAFVTGLKEG